MICRFLDPIVRLVLCFSLAFTPLVSNANDQTQETLRFFIETEIPDIDSTRFTVDFGEMTFAELSDLPAKMNGSEDILPDADKPLNVFIFVPASLSQPEREDFVRMVEKQMTAAHPKLKITATAVEIDTEQATLDEANSNARIDAAAQEVMAQDGADLKLLATNMTEANQRTGNELRRWNLGFRSSVQKYKSWISSGYTKEKDERVGGWIGKARGMASAAVWFGANKVSWATAFQIPAAFFLDWFFSKYERRVDIFKATHRIPMESVPVIKHVVRFYNDRPLLKSWIIGNLIGFLAGSYFRFWSWMENPERTSAPWSGDALATFGGAWAIGNLAGAYGAQGPRILRKKGYISSRIEYYIYVSYGMTFQLGGWFYGLGWNKAVLGLATAESVLKIGLYTYSRLRPFKEARAIAFHPALVEREVTELLYRVGLERSEANAATHPDFSALVSRLKAEQTITWKTKVATKFNQAFKSCESFLKPKN